MGRHGEAGQVTVMILGLTLVVVAVSGLAVDGTRAFLYRRTLQNAADAATTSAAGELDAAAYYRSGGRRVVVAPGAARSVAAEYLGARGIDTATSIAADTGGVAVVIEGSVPTLFLRLVGVAELPVRAASRAAPVAGR